MSENNSTPLRTNVIGGVLAGIILAALAYLFPPVLAFLAWLWGLVRALGDLFIRTYAVPGWVLAPLLILSVMLVVVAAIRVFPRTSPDYYRYVEDSIQGIRWRWGWSNNRIYGLMPYCPKCDADLVHDDRSLGLTHFICEHCNHSCVATIPGGDYVFAIAAVSREILRRIRTKEYIGNIES